MCTQATAITTSFDLMMHPHCAVKLSTVLSASMSSVVKQMAYVMFYMSVQAEALIQEQGSGDAVQTKVAASNIE